MKCLSRAEAKELQIERRVRVKTGSGPDIVLYYDSGKTNYETASEAIVAALGSFDCCVLECVDLPWGDHWGEGDPRWDQFYRWRASLGESRRLYDSPCHSFDAGEQDLAVRAVHWLPYLGWDASLYALPGRHHIFFSHDDRVEVFRARDKRKLARQLRQLGFREATK